MLYLGRIICTLFHSYVVSDFESIVTPEIRVTRMKSFLPRIDQFFLMQASSMVCQSYEF